MTNPAETYHAKIWMRDDTTLGVNNISDAVIADLGLLHNVPHWLEIEFDDAHASSDREPAIPKVM